MLLSLRLLDRRSGWLGRVELTSDQRAELAAAVSSADVSASVATRARIVLWRAEGRPKVEIAALAGVSRPTVDLWLSRFASGGVPGLLDRRRGAPREQVPAVVRGRVLALTRTSPAFLQRTEGMSVSHHYVAKLWFLQCRRHHEVALVVRAGAGGLALAEHLAGGQRRHIHGDSQRHEP